MANMPIKSFSKLSGVEASKLRYWENIGVFSPIGRNPNTNYRYYSKSQLLNLLLITTLCNLNIPLKTIAQFTTSRDPNSLLKLFDRQERHLDKQMRYLFRCYSVIHTRRELIHQGVNTDEKLIHIVPREDRAMLLWPKSIYNQNDSFVETLASIISVAAEHHINLSFPIGRYFKNMESFENSQGLPDRFFSIDPSGHHIQKNGDYLTGYSRGYHSNLHNLPKRMIAYANKKSIEIHGPVYMEYLIDEMCTANQEEHLARYSVAVKT